LIGDEEELNGGDLDIETIACK